MAVEESGVPMSAMVSLLARTVAKVKQVSSSAHRLRSHSQLAFSEATQHDAPSCPLPLSVSLAHFVSFSCSSAAPAMIAAGSIAMSLEKQRNTAPRQSRPPAGLPRRVMAALNAGNEIVGLPYKHGGGHRRFHDTGYDCSGTVSFALHGAGLIRSPGTSESLRSYGQRGEGKYITIYAKKATPSLLSPGYVWTLATMVRTKARAGPPALVRLGAMSHAIRRGCEPPP